jgi:hypothetical protein
MLPQRIHDLIEQNYQDVGAFVYQRIAESELDDQFNRVVDIFIRMPFLKDKTKEPIEKGFERLQVTLQDLKYLTILSAPIDGVTKLLPSDLRYIIRLEGMVYSDCNKSIKPTEVEEGKYYTNKGTRTVVYNSISYTTGQTFIGIAGINSYSFTTSKGTEIVNLLDEAECRIYEHEAISLVKKSPLHKTKAESPVCVLSGNTLKTYTDGFKVNGFLLDYVRNPAKLVWDSEEDWAEFSEEVIGILIDITVLRLLAKVQSPSYEANKIETLS